MRTYGNLFVNFHPFVRQQIGIPSNETNYKSCSKKAQKRQKNEQKKKRRVLETKGKYEHKNQKSISREKQGKY